MLCCLLAEMDKKEQITSLLWAAYKLIPTDVIQTPDGYDEDYFLECMKRNELLFAMEELDGVIVENKSPGTQFWLYLIEAAKLMNHGHVDRYKSILESTT